MAPHHGKVKAATAKILVSSVEGSADGIFDADMRGRSRFTECGEPVKPDRVPDRSKGVIFNSKGG